MSGPRPPRSSYHQKALQQIRNSLQPFATPEHVRPPPTNPPTPPPQNRAIEYRAQQYPFVPSQVPASVQQLLRRLDSSPSVGGGGPGSSSSQSTTPTHPSPTHHYTNNPYTNFPPSNNNHNNNHPPPPFPCSSPTSTTSPSSSSSNSPTSQLALHHAPLSKKPTLIIKSTVVPKPVLQTATHVPPPPYAPTDNPPPPPPPVRNRTPPPPPLPPKKITTAAPPPPVLPPRDNKLEPPERPNSTASSVESNIHTHESPIPERKKLSREMEDERNESKVRVYSPQAFKFFMEQHVENVIKSHQERLHRRMQLESEMAKIGLSEEAQTQMRRMLSQKESNYIRLKRAKMDKSMFKVIRTIGVGAFGEVSLVQKLDSQPRSLYAMKTLRKSDVLRRNQVAHVKAERDILAEADNEWVVKLYYSFQDLENLYFVMDYIPGGDLMSLLIKKEIFEEHLARFYIAELTCAVESVHKMGFIHRDIKPDNILIDRDGHIKLTDFGLCTGFRWTHNSKYYTNNDNALNCDQCEHNNKWPACSCETNPSNKPAKPLLEVRRRNKEHVQRCLAHSLVGTPNYIAPEVLMRIGYTQLCDWWSVGVILYEMLVGRPPFLAPTPAETQYKVINWATTLRVPPQANLSHHAKDLILKLCTDHTRRLGKNGAHEVKVHSFFTPLPCDINSIRRTQAPYAPRIAHPTDTSNFDPCDAEKDDPSDSGNPPDNQFHGFYEFTFRRFFDDAYNEELIFNTGGASGGNNNNNNSGGGGSGGGGSSSGPVYV